MSNNTSTMFVNDVTVIDHAYIDDKGKIIGGTYRLDMEVTGRVESEEQVVIDFSACKSLVKKWIDDTPGGFDHKLVLYPGFSLYEYGDYGLIVNTPRVSIIKNGNMTVIDYDGSSLINSAQTYLSDNLSEHLTQSIGANIRVDAKLSERTTMPKFSDKTVSKTFRYAHGLKNSTSYGCQNIAHGHLSYISIDGCDDINAAQTVIETIVSDLDCKLLINKHDLEYSEEDYYSNTHSYTSKTRGRFILGLACADDFVKLDTDTTIENIVEYVATKYSKELKEAGASRLYISEGLCKGAVKELQ